MEEEEITLRKRLDELERKYRESLFGEVQRPGILEEKIEKPKIVEDNFKEPELEQEVGTEIAKFLEPKEIAKKSEIQKKEDKTKAVEPKKPGSFFLRKSPVEKPAVKEPAKSIVKETTKPVVAYSSAVSLPALSSPAIPSSATASKPAPSSKPSKPASSSNTTSLDLPNLGLPEIKEDNNKKFSVPGIKDNRPDEGEIKIIAGKLNKLRKEIGKVVVGQEKVIDGLIMGLLCDAHVLVEGVPGIAKTLAIRALGSVTGCEVKRIQFTVDMLPTDITGITNYTPDKGFEVIKGPVFANFVIADEINRAPPKTQSALMEAMQEKQVTIGKERFSLPNPFFVMATENPIENAGVYPLPEAQVDRFLFKLIMDYPEFEAEKRVLETNMTLRRFEEFDLKAVTSPDELIKMQKLVKRVYLDDTIKNYIVSIVRKTRQKDFPNAEYLSYGSSPRASIGLFIAGKARALMQGRNYVLPEDVKEVIFNVLRHRLILSYKASIKKISPDDIIKDILSMVKVE